MREQRRDLTASAGLSRRTERIIPLEWITDWASIPDAHDKGLGSRTHGVAVLGNGHIAVLAQASPALHIFDRSGRLVHAWGERLGGAHGLTHVIEDGDEYLWITDQSSGEVSRRGLDGKVCQTIAPPPAEEGKYAPTSVAVCPGGGDIWVADGYGSNLVRRYARDGHLIGKLTGEEGPGLFARPHGIAFHTDKTLYIADRRNKRICIYDKEGKFLFYRNGVTHSPCGFAVHGDRLYVPELFGSLKMLDRSLNVIASYGTNFDVRPKQGWPECEGWGWPELSGWPDSLSPSRRNSSRFIAPHAAAVATDGTIYVVEWIRGGRIIRLRDEEHLPSG